MKTIKILSVLFLLVAVSCQKNDSNENINVNFQNVSIGKLHNQGLTYIANALSKKQKEPGKIRASSSGGNQTPVESIPEEVVLSSTLMGEAYDFVTQIPEYTNLQVNAELSELVTNGMDYLRISTPEGAFNYWDALIEEDQIGSVISLNEQAIMQEFGEIFRDIFVLSLPDDQKYNLLKSKLQTLKIKYDDISSEIFDGAMDVALNSTEYWYNLPQQGLIASSLYHSNFNPTGVLHNRASSNQPVPIPNDPIPVNDPAYLIQADAIGYLVTWGQAVWEDSKKPGGVTPEGANDRIGRGLWGAISFSAAAAIPVKPTTVTGGDEIEFIGYVPADILPFPEGN